MRYVDAPLSAITLDATLLLRRCLCRVTRADSHFAILMPLLCCHMLIFIIFDYFSLLSLSALLLRFRH